MSHGVLFSDGDINSIISGDSSPMVYWGKKVINHTYVSNQIDNYIYPVFDIPDTEPCVMFFSSNVDDLMVYVEPYKDAGVWKVMIPSIFNTSSCSFDVFVFVDCTIIPVPDYGMVVYDDLGNLRWHTARPALSITDVGEYTGTFRPASTGDAYMFNAILFGPSSQWRSVVSFFGCHYDTTLDGYKILEANDRLWTSRRTTIRTIPSEPPIIDADYYETFTSLGNY